MSMNLPSIGSAQTPYGPATIHVGRYPIGGALYVELYTADDEMPEPLATLSCNLAPSGVTLADDEFCVKAWSENEPLIAPASLRTPAGARPPATRSRRPGASRTGSSCHRGADAEEPEHHRGQSHRLPGGAADRGGPLPSSLLTGRKAVREDGQRCSRLFPEGMHPFGKRRFPAGS